MDPIMARRSIRKYRSDVLQGDVLERLVEAGMAAPCANGRRSWHFVVIDDRELLDAVPKFHPYSKMVLEAPAAILVCADPEVEPTEGYWAQNCSAATENILVEATGMGLGTVWLGIYPRTDRIEAMRKLLSVPEDIVPFSLIVVGRPAEKKEPHGGIDRQRLHWNGW